MSDEIECVVSIEEIPERVGSTCHDDRSKQQSKLVDINEQASELKKLVEDENQWTTSTVAPSLSPTPPPPPKIGKVLPFFRSDPANSKYYEPRVVSVGPIHHGEENLRVAEKYKSKLAARFIKESGQELEALRKIIEDIIGELKNYFGEGALEGYDDNTLSWILFVDGCAVIQFVHSFTHGKLKDFMIKNDHIALAQHDLFLLENQIPFEVLKKLMSKSGNLSAQYKESIKKFIRISVMAPPEYTGHLDFEVDDLDPIHLLDLLQKVVSKKPEEKHLPQKNKSKKPEKKHLQPSFRNIQELKAAGIHLKPSKSSSLTDITFNSNFFAGQLHLPPMIVDDSMAPKFLNLIAYECCPDNFRTDYEVTSYICFLDSLIDHPNDVKEMRSAKILYNLLGSDDEVASLFNKIATDLVPHIKHYEEVKNAIQKHYETMWRTWMAQFYHDHFSSPWTFLASTAALVALALTGIQTWFGVFSQSDPCCNIQRSTHG